MAVDVITSIEVELPRERVAPWAADPDHVPLWYENIKQVDWLTPKPLALGTRLAFVAHFLGRRLAYTYEVVEWQPLERLVMRTSEGTFPMETSYVWEALSPARTRMTLRNRGQPSGFSQLAAPLLALAMRRANRKDLSTLKRVLEEESR